jgi:hypothetical protein
VRPARLAKEGVMTEIASLVLFSGRLNQMAAFYRAVSLELDSRPAI